MLANLWNLLKGEAYDYKSPDEIFLRHFDEKYPRPSASQIAEITRAQVIAAGRDKK